MAEGASPTATLMMTDIADAPRLWGALLGQMPTLLARHGAQVAETVVRLGGSLVKLPGNRHVAVFKEVGHAVQVAVEIQRASQADSNDAPLGVRIAIHSGAVSPHDWDDHGPVANRCARILELGHAGQILVSETAAAHTKDGVGLRSLGHHRLRDLLRPEALFQVVADGLPDEFPELASLNGSNIPIQYTTFVGRTGEIEAIGAHLRQARLLTLVGPGGVGKTRLAYQVAAESAGRFPDGAVVVQFADVPSSPATALATALGLAASPMEPIERAVAGLRDRRLLLVLDNCEHILDEMRPLVRKIIAECPLATILATSRQAIGAPGEESHDILPLTLPPESPDAPAQILESEAGRLFVDRAGAHLNLDDGNMVAVAAICRRLDGLPLAIELAAARCDALSPQEILDRLVRRFEVLARDPDASDRRHRTMQEAIEWSNQLLVAAERTLLGRLTAFRGGWTLESVEAALRHSWDHLDDPFDVLRSLVDKSLVFTEDMVDDSVRYRFLETVREFVRGTMAPREVEISERGLFDWATDFGDRASEGLEGLNQRRWFNRVDLEWENLRLAMAYGFSRPELRDRTLKLAVDLRHFWVARGHYGLGRELIESALEAEDGTPGELRTRATNLAGVLALGQGDLGASRRRLSESLQMARALGDVAAQGSALSNLGMVAWEQMDFEAARQAFEEGAAVLETTGERAKVGTALANLGCVLIDMGRLYEAREALSSCLEPLQQGRSLDGIAFAKGNLGYLAIVRGDWDEAVGLVRESLGAFGLVGDWKGIMNTLISAATLLAAAKDLERAATIRGAIEKMSATAGAEPTPRDTRRLAEIDRALASFADPAALRALKNKGLSMSSQHGVEYALYALMAIAPKAGDGSAFGNVEMNFHIV